MVAPVRGRGRGQRNGLGKPRGRGGRPFNVNGPPPPPFPNPQMMPPLMGPFGPRGRPMPPPPMMRGPPRRGGPRMMGPRVPPPMMHPPMRPPPPGLRPPPPPHMMNRPPLPPPMAFRGHAPRGRGPFKGVQKGKIMKKRKPNAKPLDLTKSWVTDAIKSEFAKKEELLAKAKESSKTEDWTTYREQRDKCTKIYNAAEMEFVGQQEGAEDFGDAYEDYEEFDEEEFEETFEFSCDTCERDFPTENLYEKHMSEHRICGIDECTFTAHEKVLENHIKMQHSTGLYDKIRNLNTPEEIEKWVQDRKLKYPTKENVEKRYEKQEEMLKRGVKISERNNRFGRDKTRLTRIDPATRRKQRENYMKKKNEKINKAVQRYQPKSLIDEKADWNGNMFPFKGTREIYAQTNEEEEISDFEDEEWNDKPSNNGNFIKVNASLGALIGAYGSDNSDEEPIEKDCETKIEKQNSDDEAPLEIKIVKTNLEPEEIESKTNNEIKTRTKRRSRKRKAGDGDFVINEKKSKINYKFPYQNFKKRKITLLEKLLDSEIRRERNILLQCVKFVVENDFFKKQTT